MTAITPDRRPGYLRSEGETIIDFRRRRELVVEARSELKRLDVAEQTSGLNLPGARIRAWEKVHALMMPSSPDHSILRQIATTTQLTMAQVLTEQRLRSPPAT